MRQWQRCGSRGLPRVQWQRRCGSGGLPRVQCQQCCGSLVDGLKSGQWLWVLADVWLLDMNVQAVLDEIGVQAVLDGVGVQVPLAR